MRFKIFVTLLITCLAGLVYSIETPTIDLDIFSRTNFGYGFSGQEEVPIVAYMAGTVIDINNNESNSTNLGKYAILEHNLKIDDESVQIYTVYSILSSVDVAKGQSVSSGEAIGYAGGNSPLQTINKSDTFYFALFSDPSNIWKLYKKFGQATYAHSVVWFDPFYEPKESDIPFDYNSYTYIDRLDLANLSKRLLGNIDTEFVDFSKWCTRVERFEELLLLDQELSLTSNQMFGDNGLPVSFRSMYNNYFISSIEGIEYVFLVQDNLIEYLADMREPTTVLQLYVVLGVFEPKQQRVFAYVNEYQEKTQF